MKTKILTLSALSSALAAIVLILGTVFHQFLDLASVVIAPMFLAIPLYYNSVKGSFLATLSAGILALLLTGIGNIATNVVYISYFLFFGFFPLIKYLSLTKRWNKYLTHTLCCIWFIITAIVIYLFWVEVLGLEVTLILPIDKKLMPVVVMALAVPIYFLVDMYVYTCQIMMFKFIKRIVKN